MVQDTRREHVVDQHEEPLIRNLSIRVQENCANVLHPYFNVETSDITLQTERETRSESEIRLKKCVRACACVCYPQVSNAIAFAQSDLKDLKHAEEGSQATQTLFPTATYSNKQRISHWSLQNSADPASKSHTRAHN